MTIEDDPDHTDLITEALGEEDLEKDIILARDGQKTIDYFQELSVKRYRQIENEIINKT